MAAAHENPDMVNENKAGVINLLFAVLLYALPYLIILVLLIPAARTKSCT